MITILCDFMGLIISEIYFKLDKVLNIENLENLLNYLIIIFPH